MGGAGPDAASEDLSALPERTCIVTRRKGTPDDLVRFVLDPDGAVVPDLKARLPGRGVWVDASRQAVAEAVKRRLFGRGFRREARTAATLADDVAALLRRDAIQALSLANKAGCVVTGFGKVEAAAGSQGLAALVHAADAADDGIRKIGQALRRVRGERSEDVPVIRDFSSEELSLALGGALVIHAALVAGPGSDGFLSRWRRMARYDGKPVTGPASDGGMTSRNSGQGARQDRTAE